MDAAAPPAGDGAYGGHASTLAIEVTSGRRPMIVSCGSGAEFGADWHKAGRATPSHSVLGLDGYKQNLDTPLPEFHCTGLFVSYMAAKDPKMDGSKLSLVWYQDKVPPLVDGANITTR